MQFSITRIIKIFFYILFIGTSWFTFFGYQAPSDRVWGTIIMLVLMVIIMNT